MPMTHVPAIGAENQYQYKNRACHDVLFVIENRLVAWHSGRTLVFDRRTCPVLRSTCS